MLWSSKGDRIRERRRVRQLEAQLSVAYIRSRFGGVEQRIGKLNVLEFGCGAGYQIPALQALGSVTACDIFRDPDLTQAGSGRYLICDIARAPFVDGCFDVIYSNHVLEHVKDVAGALRELQRIGREGSIIAVSLPTPTWIVLSLPTQLLDKFLNLAHRVSPSRSRCGTEMRSPEQPLENVLATKRPLARLLFHGHGQFPGFFEALRHFRAPAWRRLFERHDLRVLAEKPLLAYATARWPIIPVNTWMVRLGIVSSRLYILQPSRRTSPSRPGPAESAAG